MIKRFIFWVVVACAAAVAPAQAKTIYSEHFTLKNGMEVIVIPNHKVPAVSHMVWYKVGSIDEPYGKSGIAHFLEHMMFKATDKLASGEFSKIVAENGGIENAFTSFDFTSYFQNIAVDKLPTVMELEADRMRNLRFNEDEITKERAVILEERNMRVDNDPGSQLTEQMRAVLYLHHPYGTPLIGWRHEIEALSKEDLTQFYHTYYAPNNAILVVSGDITAAKLKPMAEKYFGSIEQSDIPPRRIIKEPEPRVERRVELFDPKVNKPELVRYYLAPSQTVGEKQYAYALTLLSQILGGSETSRLYQALVVDQGLAAGAASYYDDLGLGPEIFGIKLVLKDEKDLEAAENAMDAVLASIVKDGITDEELARVKYVFKADTLYSRDGFRTLAYAFGQALASGLSPAYVENWEDTMGAVTKEQIQQAAAYVLQKRKSVTGILHVGQEKEPN